ncbi:MAG: DNA ligase D [Myxococcota bacterium]
MAKRDKLSAYRAKRKPSQTTEPLGGASSAPGLFVLHKHHATRIHWDLRLELGGVLVSWAVPKGPSLDPSEKRFAVQVEDHPVEYGEFEGVIPEGNYGAGPVIIWDRGRWVPIEDPVAGMENGKLLFDLHGYKVRGRFTLVKTTRGDNDWLLIKKPDQFAVSEDEHEFSDRSVISGLTADEVAAGEGRRFDLDRFPRTKIELRAPKVMLAETSRLPFNRKNWIFELKFDGYRLTAVKSAEGVRLFYRSGNEATDLYPEIVQAVAALPVDSLILDGEVVVNDATGRPSFNLLQQRSGLSRERDVARARIELPAVHFIFDLLALNGRNLRGAELRERRSLLREILPDAGPLRYSDEVETQGKALFAQVEKLGLEGIIAKDARSRYQGARSSSWQKVKAEQTDTFVVVGFKIQKDGTEGLGSLAIAAWEGERLKYTGRVGSGFSEDQRNFLYETLEASRVAECPCVIVPAEKGIRWVEPSLLVRVRYREWVDSGVLRFPVFEDIVKAKLDQALQLTVSPPTGEVTPEPVPVPSVTITNATKMFWPDEGYTKGDLIEYYRAIAPWLLPHLEDRPVVLTRYPDGIAGKSFFQKDAPDWTPDWMRRVRMWSEHAEREIDYFVVDSVEALVYLANSAAIPLHVWASRVGGLNKPDWATIDLDPKEAPFEHVVAIAREIHKICATIDLPHYVKTTGSSGLHILLPLDGSLTHAQARSLAEIVGRIVVDRMPEVATLKRTVSEREGRVYVDTGQNGHGKLIASPFSVRPVAAAAVSMPLRWNQITRKLHPRRFTIRNALKHLDKEGDALLPMYREAPDVMGALSRLHALLDTP